MPVTKKSAHILGTLPQPFPSFAGATCSVRASIAVKGDEPVGTIFELVELPAGCRVVDIVIDADDLDTNAAPTIALDVGFVSGDPGSDDPARACGAEFLAASEVARAGGAARPTLKTAYRTAPSAKGRSIGAKLATAAATGAAGLIGLTVLFSA